MFPMLLGVSRIKELETTKNDYRHKPTLEAGSEVFPIVSDAFGFRHKTIRNYKNYYRHKPTLETGSDAFPTFSDVFVVSGIKQLEQYICF